VKRALVALAGFALVGAAGESAPPSSPVTLAPAKVVTEEIASPPPLQPGDHAEIAITLHIAPGYHTMSDHPSSEYSIATDVHFDSAPGIVSSPARYPKSTTFVLDGKQIATFAGDLRIVVPVTVAADAAPGAHELAGTLRYQACTAVRCLFPVKRPLAARIVVEP
jgi:DsbC/DsbD-like thiol-disulfide interchange protein